MYVCMYVCTYVCMYVCMFVCNTYIHNTYNTMLLCMLYTSFTWQSKTTVYMAYTTNRQLISYDTRSIIEVKLHWARLLFSVATLVIDPVQWACYSSVYMAGRPTIKMLIQNISLFCHKHPSIYRTILRC